MTLAILGAFLDLTLIHFVGHSRQLSCNLFLNGMPMTWYSIHKHRGYSELLNRFICYYSELILIVVLINELGDSQFAWTIVIIRDYLRSGDQIDSKIFLRRHSL